MIDMADMIYIIGVGVGIGAAAVVTAVMWKSYKKKGKRF